MASNAKNLAELLNQDSTVAAGDVADGSITTAKLAADAVTAAKLADNAVVTANIQDNAVTVAKQSGSTVGAFAFGGTITEYESGGTRYRNYIPSNF